MLESLFSPGALTALLQVLVIDLVLAGDNAVAVGLVAGGLPKEQRRKLIVWGLAAAVATRIVFALVATQLLGIIGLLFAGGLLLLWVCWKMWRELRSQSAADADEAQAPGGADGAPHIKERPAKSFRSGLLQILAADVSMSLDNVLAVAGAAREHPLVLTIGLLVSVALMGVAASWIARLLHRYRWIGYAGLLIVLYVALHMMWEGHRDVVRDLGRTPEYNRVMPGPLDIKPSKPAH